ncbi:MAG: hypothetical protein ACJAWS_002259 [Oleiphilaceae bacterium]
MLRHTSQRCCLPINSLDLAKSRLCCHVLLSFSAAKKDALYDLLNREDLDWRKLQLLTAKKVLKAKGYPEGISVSPDS